MPLTQNICVVCTTPFLPTSRFHPNQKCCSKKCRYVVANKKNSIYKAKWQSENSGKVDVSRNKYVENNPEKVRIAKHSWYSENKSYYTERASVRNGYRAKAKPKWLNELDKLWIAEIYDLARRTNRQVDHIIPVRNKIVCGLHVPWNLQLLTKEENTRKSNRFYQDEDVVAVLTRS